MAHKPPHWPDLDTLAALGFGPDAALMIEPKLFVDRRLLSALLLELEGELSFEQSRAALFQIGLLHGLRDAIRILRGSFQQRDPGAAGGGAAMATPLAVRLGGRTTRKLDGALEIAGDWPERYEADARLARLGGASAPSCALSAGYTSGWLSGILDIDILALESECVALGHSGCRFWAREIDTWRSSDHAGAAEIASAVRFREFRALAASGLPEPCGTAQPETRPPLEDFGAFDPEAPVVHVWGPVMVLPFTGADEALRTLDLLARDPATPQIRAVVVDLRETVLDEAFGALALEQVLATIESWGAEAILAGISPLSESAVQGLAQSHLLLRKDLPEAIAAAFQIADAQRAPL